ncbi:MAG: DNA-methyltransferase [bacterium]
MTVNLAPSFADAGKDKVDLIYIDPPFNSNNDFGHYDDRWPSMADYLSFLLPRITRGVCYLRDGGNLLIHVDWRASHYVKIAVDRIMGYENFHNEIVWRYNSGGASKKHLSRKHDVILWWSKGDGYTFNVLREPYATPDVQGRAGFHPEGRMLTDVWDIPFISTTSKERTGYPTQKPLNLLRRVVEVFSNPGDLVLDGFCGSGTTGVAAKLQDRDCILVDESPEAVRIAKERLAKV